MPAQQPASPCMTDEARRQIAWRRLLEAALCHGEQILAEEEAQEGQDETPTDAGKLMVGVSETMEGADEHPHKL